MATQKEIAAQLGVYVHEAVRAGRGASDKQVWFLAGLMAEAGETVEDLFGNSSDPLTCRLASSFIDDYLTERKVMQTRGITRKEARAAIIREGRAIAA